MATATQATHTPGPWTAEACFRYNPNTQRRVPDGFEIHGPEHQGVAGIVENESDASLLAAAPEMLAALQDLAQIAREYVAEGIPRLDAAIEKAAFVALKARGEVL